MYDSAVYRNHCGEVDIDLSDQFNISFMWNSDGVQLNKSSKFGIWPFFLKILEMSPLDRSKPCNMLMPASWFGPTKANGNSFMDSITGSLEKIYSGIPLYAHDFNQEIEVRGEVICGTCDLPAKALFLNHVNWRGTYGCHTCLIKTEAVGRHRVFAQTENLENQTSEQSQRYTKEAVGRNQSVFAVKGPTS